jgi:hypothetical protein
LNRRVELFCRLGASSGVYLFNAPLKQHFEEQARQEAQQQQAAAAAVGSGSGSGSGSSAAKA